jgi:hypothetical protein
MNTDDLSPLFESRETRMGRLPEEGRAKFEVAAQAAADAGDTDFTDRHLVSLWLSRRTGLPRADVLNNFDAIAGRFFGQTTAAGAYDKISSFYQSAGIQEPVSETENPEAFAGAEGLAKVGRGALMVNADQSARSAYGGFTGMAQRIPAGFYSQLASGTGVSLKDPMDDAEFRELRTKTLRLEDSLYGDDVFEAKVTRGAMFGFTRRTPEEIALRFGPDGGVEKVREETTANRAKMEAIRTRIDAENREALKAWKDSLRGEASQEFRRLADFWYELSGGAMERAGVNPEFQNTVLGQFMQSVGSVPATAALAAMGPAGAVGLESAFFADVEAERRGIEGEAYDPQAAFVENLASAGPQMVLERAFGLERLLASVLSDVPKIGGKVVFGDFAKQFVKRGLVAGAEEGITEPTQNFWNDFIASQTYDQSRELLTEEAAKERLVESVSAFTLGFFFAGGITSLEAIDQNRAAAKGQRYLLTREGQPMTEADFRVLRQAKSDTDLMATAPDEAVGKLLIAAANGDMKAQGAYNSRVLAEKFVDTDGLEVDGVRLGMVDGVAAATDVATGEIHLFDVANPEARTFFDNLKQRAVQERATKETLAGLQERFGEALKVERLTMPETLADRVRSGAMTQEQAEQALDVAKTVNGLAQEVTLDTAQVQGAASIREVQEGVFQMVAKVAASANPTVAIEEVAESYVKRSYAEQNLKPEELDAVRLKWHADNGEQDAAAGMDAEARGRANIEWFSKRVIDYALANRKTELPGGWGKWLRTLGERLKSILRGAAKMKKLMREGKLDADLETLMKGALGQVTPRQVRSKLDASKADAARAARQAELDQVFEAQGTEARIQTERVLRSYQGYAALKEQLAAEEQAAALASLRADREAEAAAERQRDFVRAKMEEELQAVIDDRLGGAEAIAGPSPLTEEEVFVAEMLADIPVYDLEVKLSKQAEELLAKYEGETEQSLTEEARALNSSYRRAERGNREALPTVDEMGQEVFETVAEAEDFPTITGNVDDGFTVKAPDGQEVGAAQELEKAQRIALQWYEDEFQREERRTVMDELGWGADEELQRSVIRRGGLLAPSQEPVFKGELKALAENMDAGQRMRLFRKGGKPLDYLIQYLREDGFNFETANDLLIALDQSTRGEPVFPTFSGETFNLTETPAFKAWFKDSKVVDAEGKPLVVYHGTYNPEFTAFKPNSYFASDPEIASEYIQTTDRGAVYPAYIKLENPLYVRSLTELVGEIPSIEAEVEFGAPLFEALELKAVRAAIKEAGYDGVRFRDMAQSDNRPHDAWLVFEPEQIKSATGNRGTFDAKNPDITFNLEKIEQMDRALKAMGFSPVSSGIDRGGAHTPSDPESGAPAWGLNTNGIYPDDVYSINGLRYYGTGEDKMDREAFGKLARLAGHADRQVRVYRSVEKDSPARGIQPGDWVTIVKEYAVDHGKSALGGNYRIQEKLVMAGDIFTSGDSWLEWGYHPQDHTALMRAARIARRERLDARPPNDDITFAISGIPQNQAQVTQAMLTRLQAKRLAASVDLLQRLDSGAPLPERVAKVSKSLKPSLAAEWLVPLVTRLDAISKKANLGQRLRRFDYDLNMATKRDYDAIRPFIDGVSNLPERDARVLDLALKNGETQSRDAVLRAYGLADAYARVEQVLAGLRQRAIAAGYDVGFIENYFPRKIRDVDGLMVHYYGQPQQGRIEEALREAAKKAQEDGRVMTRLERIEVTNSVLRGFRRPESKPGNLKGRKTDVLDVEADKFYAPSAEALVSYVESLNSAIERRRFFGRFGVMVRTTPGAVSDQLAVESSIGAYVEGLIEEGAITRQQQDEVMSILESRFVTRVQSDFIRNFKSLAYITTMGHVTSAMTQVSDLAFSLYENGFWDTAASAGRALVRKSKITKQELGLDVIADEFRDPGKMAKALDRTFKMVGIHYLDMIGKETLVNAKFRRMQREASQGKLSARSKAILDRAFTPAQAAQVARDIAAGRKTEDTLFAVYSVLADYQPLTPSEYPQGYLNNPNGRIFYMLKSFTLKQFDAFRREAITKIVSGNAKQKVEGFRNLAHLAGLLFLIGAPVDWLKDFIMGRAPVMEDIMIDNVFKLVGVNRWALWQFRERQNPVESAMMLIAPPAPFLVYPLQDIQEAYKRIAEGEEIEPGNFESWRALPLVGSPVYWHVGGGAAKIAEREERGSSLR